MGGLGAYALRIPLLGLVERHPREDTSGPAIGVNHSFLDEDVATEARHQHRPHQVVHGAERKDTKRDDAVQVVGQLVVDTLASAGWDIGSHHQVDVGQTEEDGDGQRRPDAGSPVREVLRLGHVDVDESTGHEDVDDGQWVGDEAVSRPVSWDPPGSDGGMVNLLDQEVVGISRGRSQHDDDGHDPVLEEASSGRVERPVAGPDLREGEDAFTTQSLDNCNNISCLTSSRLRADYILRP